MVSRRTAIPWRNGRGRRWSFLSILGIFVLGGCDAPSYALLTGSGFTDTWAQMHPGDPGPTCCQASDLLNTVSTLDQRLDFVFWHEGLSLWRGGFDNVRVEIVGEAQADRTASGLWPSDHAGVVATLTVAPRAAGP